VNQQRNDASTYKPATTKKYKGIVREIQLMRAGSIYGTSQIAITCVLFSSRIKQRVQKFTQTNREQYDLENLVA
jgi:Holliday junction resolvase RusA-like endonuclease